MMRFRRLLAHTAGPQYLWVFHPKVKVNEPPVFLRDVVHGRH